MGSQCEVASDPLCKSGSSLCASWPICKPPLAYSNPCEVGTPLADNVTNEIMFCYNGKFFNNVFPFLVTNPVFYFSERQNYGREIKGFFDEEPEYKTSRAMSNRIICPKDYVCTKLHKEAESVCCPVKAKDENKPMETRQQTSKFSIPSNLTQSVCCLVKRSSHISHYSRSLFFFHYLCSLSLFRFFPYASVRIYTRFFRTHGGHRGRYEVGFTRTSLY